MKLVKQLVSCFYFVLLFPARYRYPRGEAPKAQHHDRAQSIERKARLSDRENEIKSVWHKCSESTKVKRADEMAQRATTRPSEWQDTKVVQNIRGKNAICQADCMTRRDLKLSIKAKVYCASDAKTTAIGGQDLRSKMRTTLACRCRALRTSSFGFKRLKSV